MIHRLLSQIPAGPDYVSDCKKLSISFPTGLTNKWLLSVNVEKSAILVLRSLRSDPVDLHIELHGSCIPQVSTHRHLGVTVNDSLTWCDHTQAVIKKTASVLGYSGDTASGFPH